jgi:peptidoglycan/LPS O-acetylase OafA/YrhL
LRAVAVASAIVFHFLSRAAKGGYLGVDVFFVLSGYLITSLLLVEWDRTGRIDLRAFWARRARRLLPALFLVLMAVAVWSAFALEPRELTRIRSEGLWTLFYGANWYLIHGGEAYFHRFSDPSPFFHTWSLAVEEQFYLLWPLIMFACLRISRGKPRALVVVAVVISVVSVLLMALLYVPTDHVRAYEGTDVRAHQLLIGALLAVALSRDTIRRRVDRFAPAVLGFVAALACGAAVLFLPGPETNRFLYWGGSGLFALAVAAVIAAAVAPGRSPIKSFLALPPLVWVGRISYGLYLWHVPVKVAVSHAHTGLPGPELFLLRVVTTLGLATLSFYLVEQPIRRGAIGARLARVATPVAIAGVTTALIIATAAGTAG